MKPAFVDNRNGNTLKAALAGHLEHRLANGQPPTEVCIASAYFNPAGFAQVAAQLERVPKVRLLLGAEPSPESGLVRRMPEDPQEPEFTRRRLREGINRLDAALKAERDFMAFSMSSSESLKSLVRFLRSGKIDVRRFEKAFLHAKAYIFTGEEAGFMAGSSNFTRAGLTSNLELNLGLYGHPVVQEAQKWYEDLWQQAAPYDLAAIYEEMFKLWRPWDVYLRILWELYGKEVSGAEVAEGRIPLTNFQKHGVWRAQTILEKFGGVIVADEVGLGKTFIGGDLMRLYCERRQRVLLVCPAALRDSTWKRFISRYQLFIECRSYEELASDRQFAEIRETANQAKLSSALEEYALVVVDEAHNYRNEDTKARAAVLRKLLFGRRKDLVLLTATPVNNSLWDLFTLIRYFLKQDSALADRGVLSIRERFENAMRIDPTSLSPDLLYPVIDATTVKRTRAFVKKHYEGEKIRGPDGKLVPIVFPQPRPITVRYDLEAALPGFFDRIVDALDPDNGTDLIEFARYRLAEYRKDGDDDEIRRGHAVVGLLRSGLLKRFESSAHAFGKTIGKMAEQHRLFLKALDAGKVINTEFLHEISGDDEIVFEEELETSEHIEPASVFRVKELKSAVEADLRIMQRLASDAAKVQPSRDPKLQALIVELKKIVRQAEEEGLDSEDRQQKRKVLIFSFFADTVDWIRIYLAVAVANHPELTPYKKRVTFVVGSMGGHDESRETSVWGFAPTSSEAPAGLDQDKFDILVTTDVLAEGVNLQQCRHIINYDMPWNPMRLVQRHGRIDRIGSPYERVFLRTIFPHDRLDDLLDLEERILNKLAQAAASIGVGTPPIAGARGSSHVFADTREEIEKLAAENPELFERGGTAAAAQTGEEYRQQLRKALERDRNRILSLPWKAGAGMRKGKDRGVLFCAKVGDRIYLRFVRAGQDWQAVRDPALVLTELGTCLRMIECTEDTPSVIAPALHETVFDFWDVARAHVFRSWEEETDPASVQPKVRPLNRKAAEYLRANVPQDFEADRVQRVLDILESPWPRREELMLRDEFAREALAPGLRSQRIIDFVEKSGLEPFSAPEPLPPIGEEDIHLVGWIALDVEEDRPLSNSR